MPSLTMLGDGATLPSTTLTSLSLYSSTLLNTKLELSLFLTEGNSQNLLELKSQTLWNIWLKISDLDEG